MSDSYFGWFYILHLNNNINRPSANIWARKTKYAWPIIIYYLKSFSHSISCKIRSYQIKCHHLVVAKIAYFLIGRYFKLNGKCAQNKINRSRAAATQNRTKSAYKASQRRSQKDTWFFFGRELIIIRFFR